MAVMAIPDWTIPRRSQQNGLRVRRRLGLTPCNQGLPGTAPHIPWRWAAADMAAIGLHVPGRAVVVLADAQDRVQLRLQGRIADQRDDLRASRRIAAHPVCDADSNGDGPDPLPPPSVSIVLPASGTKTAVGERVPRASHAAVRAHACATTGAWPAQSPASAPRSCPAVRGIAACASPPGRLHSRTRQGRTVRRAVGRAGRS